MQQCVARYSSKFFFLDECNALFCNYQCKKSKNVCLLSTMHASPSCDTTSEKKKPEVVLFYNKNKVGVDCVDQMLRKYTTHSSTRRWPVAVWCNMLDIALLNSWIVYRIVTGSNITRRCFMLQLIEELRSKIVRKRDTIIEIANSPGPSRRRKCRNVGCNNGTVTCCRICGSPTCGRCSVDDTRLVTVICQNCEH